MEETFVEQLKSMINTPICSREIATKFLKRANQGKLTRDENKETHFCVYFAAYDPYERRLFLGHHKKSGLWLFNGGHIDQGETPEQALEREIAEEWGIKLDIVDIGKPSLLTVTEINNPTKQPCKLHYDIWYFVRVRKDEFLPDIQKLDKEFHKTRWISVNQAGKLVIDLSTKHAIDIIGTKFGTK